LLCVCWRRSIEKVQEEKEVPFLVVIFVVSHLLCEWSQRKGKTLRGALATTGQFLPSIQKFLFIIFPFYNTHTHTHLLKRREKQINTEGKNHTDNSPVHIARHNRRKKRRRIFPGACAWTDDDGHHIHTHITSKVFFSHRKMGQK
jgi:hypothetical protein